jgi:hypothetical protein
MHRATRREGWFIRSPALGLMSGGQRIAPADGQRGPQVAPLPAAPQPGHWAEGAATRRRAKPLADWHSPATSQHNNFSSTPWSQWPGRQQQQQQCRTGRATILLLFYADQDASFVIYRRLRALRSFSPTVL